MAHAKINLSRMFDWIERSIELDVAQPTDADIMQRFGFDNPEHARTLLAELADSGRITIKGYGETRAISLGRTKSALQPAARPTPAAKRPDPIVDAGVAKIAAIVARGPTAGASRAIHASAALTSVRGKPSPAPKPSQPTPIAAPSPTKEAPLMPAKSIQLPASAGVAIQAIETYAKQNDVSLGAATASLIEAGLAKPTTPVPAPTDVMSIDTLLSAVRARFEGLLNVPDRSDEIAMLTKRAEAAESKVEALKAALA